MNILKFKCILIFSLIFLSKSVFSQESNITSNDVVSIKDSVKIAVIDMQKILNKEEMKPVRINDALSWWFLFFSIVKIIINSSYMFRCKF